MMGCIYSRACIIGEVTTPRIKWAQQNVSTMVEGLGILVFDGVWVAKQPNQKVKNHQNPFLLIWVKVWPMFMCNFLIIINCLVIKKLLTHIVILPDTQTNKPTEVSRETNSTHFYTLRILGTKNTQQVNFTDQ